MKRIVVCADGTWNRPEQDLSKDFPTNILKLARGVRPVDRQQISQQVFYDWGIGSYYDKLRGGITGKGIVKNIVDGYRCIVQNCSPGDEMRADFEPTVWLPRSGMSLKQVWFCGAHGDVGGGNKPDRDGGLLADIPLQWILDEAKQAGLATELHLRGGLSGKATGKLHESRRHIYRSRLRHRRPIDHGKGEILLHRSVRDRYDALPKYRPRMLENYLEEHGWSGVTD